MLNFKEIHACIFTVFFGFCVLICSFAIMIFNPRDYKIDLNSFIYDTKDMIDEMYLYFFYAKVDKMDLSVYLFLILSVFFL